MGTEIKGTVQIFLYNLAQVICNKIDTLMNKELRIVALLIKGGE